MCLPGFIEFKRIKKVDAITGYRIWYNGIKEDNLILKSQYQHYNWKSIEGPHKVTESNSGIYAYNNYNNNYNNYYYNYYYNYNNYYNYNYNNNYNYYLQGIIKQYGKIAFHRIGQRSQYAYIEKLFTTRLSDARGPKEFLDWIEKFNSKIELIAKKYNCSTIHFQDFLEHEQTGSK